MYCTGRPLEALWHTAVVVYDREYYFGSAGIESVPPGTTMLGNIKHYWIVNYLILNEFSLRSSILT